MAPPQDPSNMTGSPENFHDQGPGESAAAKGATRRPGYRTAPLATTRLPPGVPYIVGNEAAERFSFYGLKAILFTFMTERLLNAAGEPALLTEPQAREAISYFNALCYATPLLGAILADRFLGKYRTIIALSLVYCAGHAALAFDSSQMGLLLGLFLIGVGAGGIKPCVSSHVGDQFGQTNQHLIERVFGWFYLSINVGAAISSALTPWLLERYGPHVAFGVPGILMAVATLVFWIGRHKFVHIPPGGSSFLREATSREGLATVARLVGLYCFIAVFWSLYDQSQSAWVGQATAMNRHFALPEWASAWGLAPPGSFEIAPGQMQAVNPVLVLILVPLFSRVVYPLVGRFVTVTPLRKMLVGFALAALAFVGSAAIERELEAGVSLHVAWQGATYLILTAAEVLVSVTALEFSYTQAPRTMKSLVMSLYLLSVTAGNLLTAGINRLIQDEAGESRLSGVDYYLLFAALMAAATLVFTVYVARYRGQTHLQQESSE